MPPRSPLPGDCDCARKKLPPAVNLTPHPFLTDVAFMSSKYDPVLTCCFNYLFSDSLKKMFCLCIYFWLCLILVAARGLSLVAASRVCSLVAVRWCRLLQSTGSRCMDSVVATHGQLPHGMWDFSRPGIEQLSPALAGGLLTTGPPGKPLSRCFQGSISELIIFSDLFPILWHNESISYILFSCCYTYFYGFHTYPLKTLLF